MDEVKHHARSHDVLLRILGNVLYLMPLSCITEAELACVYAQIDRVLDRVLARS